MPMSLDQAESELFRALGHPVRVRVLRLLRDGPKTTRFLLDAIEIEASGLSYQLAVLRSTGLVVARRDLGTVEYSLSTGEVTGLLRSAGEVLAHLAAGQGRLPVQPRVEHVW